MEKNDQITIYQAPYGSLNEHDLLLKMQNEAETFAGPVPSQYYLPVFNGTVMMPDALPEDEELRRMAMLEHVFEVFNLNHPKGYVGRSLSVGDVVSMEGRYYLCAALGFTEVVFKDTGEQRLNEIKRPDGTRLKAEVYPSDPYPCININLINQEGEVERVCFAEYNPEKEPGRELCVGVYCASDDETVYYDSYYRQKEEDE